MTYDIERSAVGFLLANQDERASAEFWTLIKALGGVGAKLVPTTEAMLTRVGKGGDLIGYNAIGSYAEIESKKEPALGFVYPRDYTLVVTRIMLIGKKAANPNAARLWVDYVLSRRGQTVLANRASLLPLRADVEGANSAAALAKTLGQSVKPIPLGAGPARFVFRSVEAADVPQAMAAGHRRETIEAGQAVYARSAGILHRMIGGSKHAIRCPFANGSGSPNFLCP